MPQPLTHEGTITLETERLILRRFILEDAQDMFDNWANDPEVTKYLSWLPHESVEDTKQVLERWMELYENSTYYHWCIVPKAYGKAVGAIYAWGTGGVRCDIGYCISGKWWGQGITTESLQRVIRFLFDEVGFPRIQTLHHLENLASGRVMEKAGMVYEGIFRKYHKNKHGELVDVKIYAILKEDFKG